MESINVDLTANIIRKINDNIGIIDYFGIETPIMLTNNNGYRKGYINVTKFADGFHKKHENEKMKRIRDWGSNNKVQANEIEDIIVERLKERS